MPDFNASDYPYNSVARSSLEQFIAEAVDPLVKGMALTRLAHIYKHIGPAPGGEHAFMASARAADEAVQLLRPLEAPLALAAALRASVVAFVTDQAPGAKERLEEALKLSEEEGDLSGVGWSHWALHNHGIRTLKGDPGDFHIQEAIKAWKASGEAKSVGFALQREALAMRAKEDCRKRVSLFIDAATIYEQDGALQEAAQAYQMALTFGDEVLSKKRQFELSQRAIRCYRKIGSSYLRGAILQKGRLKKRFKKMDARKA